jgi:hypothetical protein
LCNEDLATEGKILTLNIIGSIAREDVATPRELFLSYENGKDIKVALNFSSFCFFGYIVKICILQALVLILAIGWGKNKKNAVFSHFLFSFQGCYIHYFGLF